MVPQTQEITGRFDYPFAFAQGPLSALRFGGQRLAREGHAPPASLGVRSVGWLEIRR
jgi:hypothetical protein